MITKENYEQYFIDFLEGVLSKEEGEYMEIFLGDNPEIKEELSHFRTNKKATPSVDFLFLKKAILVDESNEDDFCIGYLEGDLSPEVEKEFEINLRHNSGLEKKLNDYRNTVLIPEIIPFSEKNLLKKKQRTPLLHLLIPMASAAAILLFVWVSWQPVAQMDSLRVAKNSAQKSSKSYWEPKQEAATMEIPSKVTPMPYSKNRVNTGENQPIVQKVKPVLKKEVRNNGSDLGVVKSAKGIDKNPEYFKVLAQEVIENSPTNKVTPRRFVVDKAREFTQELTGQEIHSSAEFVSYVTNKVKETNFYDFIEIETEETNNQKYRTIRIGKKFSITRKING